MDFVTGISDHGDLTISRLKDKGYIGKEVKVKGAVHSIRNMGEIAFVILRRWDGLVQTVYEDNVSPFSFKELKDAETICATGILRKEGRAPGGIEILLTSVEVLSRPKEPLPLDISKWKLSASLEAKLDQRAIALRNVRERSKFKLQEGIVRAFREFLYGHGFTEIHTPKIGAKSAEGGANLFRLEYFHKPAVLQQSPQFYKQMMVGIFDRVFETGPVFRAEKHNTKRHLNEYTSLDFEMGYIENFTDIMEMEAGFLQYMVHMLDNEYKRELGLLDITLPKVNEIPYVTFSKAKELVSERYHRKIKNPYDLEPEEESLIGRFFKEAADADFVFVTHYPSKKRPFYAMDDPRDPMFTLSFDLLFHGGQRIHDYSELCRKMRARKIESNGMQQYLDVFRYGMPPHGGLGIGLERLTMQLIGDDNVRETTLFPRDQGRLTP